MKRLVAILLAFLAAGCLGTSTAHAADPLSFGASQYTETLVKLGTDRHLVLGARVQADYDAGAGVHVAARVDGSALGDGGAVDVALSDPTTFTTLEGTVSVRRSFGFVAPTVAYGYVLPVDKGSVPVLESYPFRAGAGVTVGDPRSGRWLTILAGVDRSAGAGTKALFAGQYPIDGRLSVVADGAIGGRGSFVRFGVAVAVVK